MHRIIIVGAGIAGLTLGQALKSQNIPFTILERDKNADMREQGWAITLHWALPLLQKMLPQELMAKLQKCQVSAEVAENDTQDFKLIDLKDCSEIFNTPSGRRWRVNRSKLRLALLNGLDDSIQWNQHVKSVELREGFAQVRCEDGKLHFADIIIGADGSNSVIRRFLCPGKHAVTPLPYRMLGVGTKLTEKQLAPLRTIDRLLFQGIEPRTGNFLYCSLLQAPTKETSPGTVQFNVSWPKFSKEEQMFPDDASRLATLKLRARGFAPCLRDAIDSIAEETPVSEIRLADWEFIRWNNSGHVTLIGDAAHPMTMFRGEAANHGIQGAYDLWKNLKLVSRSGKNMQDAIQNYERKMMERATDAILLSRQACEDAHHYPVDESSPLVTERRSPPQLA